MNNGIEDAEHFLLLCPSFDIQRQDLLAGVLELLQPYAQINSLPNNVLVQILLYGGIDLSIDINKQNIQINPNVHSQTRPVLLK